MLRTQVLLAPIVSVDIPVNYRTRGSPWRWQGGTAEPVLHDAHQQPNDVHDTGLVFAVV